MAKSNGASAIHDRTPEPGPRRPAQFRLSRFARRKSTWLILAAALSLLAIGLADHLADRLVRTASIYCDAGDCTRGPVIRRGPDNSSEGRFGIDWPQMAIGALTVASILGTWGLVGRNPRNSKRIVLLFIGTCPILLVLAVLAMWMSLPRPIIDHDMISLAPTRPFALICAGLLVFQCVVQFGFVVTQGARWLLIRLPISGLSEGPKSKV